MGLVACKRDDTGTAPPIASVDASPAPAPTRAAEPSHAEPYVFARSGPAAGEAERRWVKKIEDDPTLRPYTTRVRNHFKAARQPLPLLLQRASLLGGGAAILIRHESDISPLLLVENRERKLLWEREKPTIAMLPPVRDPVIVGRANGGVALFAYDVPAKVVAGRLLDPDGTPFADLNVLRIDDCQAVSAAFWPKRGMVVICARHGGNRLQIVRNDHTLAFSHEGVPVGQPFRAAGPMSITFDSEDSMVLAQYATKEGRDHVVVSRLDATGAPKWAEPKDLGEVPTLTNAMEKLDIALEPGGVVRVSLPNGLASRPETRAIGVAADGTTRDL